MRGALALMVFCGGCLDYGTLQKGFCDTLTGTDAVALCDDFEGAGTWSESTTGGGTLDRLAPARSDDPSVAFRGRRALRLVAPSGGTATLEETAVTVSTNQSAARPYDLDLYLRVFLYLPGVVPAGEVVLFSVGDGSRAPIVQLLLVEGLPRLAAQSGRQVDAPAPLLADDWVCVELAVRHDAVANMGTGHPRADVYFNAGPSAPPSVELSLDLPALGATRIGLDRSVPAAPPVALPTATIWMDEVILDTKRIGCTK